MGRGRILGGLDGVGPSGDRGGKCVCDDLPQSSPEKKSETARLQFWS
jgi:hypothetical protein